MSILGEVERWAVGVLEADATITGEAVGGVHRTSAPQTTPYPFVVVSMEGQPAVEKLLCGTVASYRAVYAVRAIGKNSGFTTLETLEDAIAAALPVGRVAALGARPRMAVTLVSPVRRMTANDAGEFYEAGGLYQFLITQ
ncbi:MAG: hypothetical protein V4671_31935 [Armatimonadota bacterium]